LFEASRRPIAQPPRSPASERWNEASGGVMRGQPSRCVT
jgi:hypothetical protein